MFDKDRPLSKEELILKEKFESFIKSKLPEASLTRDGFGHVVLKYKKKSFFLMGISFETGILNLSLKADKISQFEILKNKNFKVAPYLGHHGWVQIQEFNLIKKELNYILEITLSETKKLIKPKVKKK